MARTFILVSAVFMLSFTVFGQTLQLNKGSVIDSVKVYSTDSESYSLFIPRSYDKKEQWPVLFIFDLKGKGKSILSYLTHEAESEGYLLASSNNVNDSLSLSNNVLVADRMLKSFEQLFSINKDRLYILGVGSSGRFANLIPFLLPEMKGVISIGEPLANDEILTNGRPFHFIGIVSKENFTYPQLLRSEQLLNKLKYPNQLIVHEGNALLPKTILIKKALQILTLASMSKGNTKQDTSYVNGVLEENERYVQNLINSGQLLLAERGLVELAATYHHKKDVDSVRHKLKELRKQKLFKKLKRRENAVFFSESLLKEDFLYYLEEDVLTYNYNNLGWWNHQMTEIKGYTRGIDKFEKQMGKRLFGFVNALVDDYIEIFEGDDEFDKEGLLFMNMLKTITDASSFDAYLKVVSLSSEKGDFGTALFYLEEAFKNGFKDKEILQTLPNTALLRIAPEYNKLVEKYFNQSLYRIDDE